MDDASRIKRTARIAGLLYFLMSVVAIFDYFYLAAKFNVPGDAAATMRNILGGELLYRVRILASLFTNVIFLFVVLTLYQLFKDVDRSLARLMVVLVCVGTTAVIGILASDMAPLLLLSGADYLSAFTRPQLEAASFGALRLGGNLGQVVSVFWGLWLFPFGMLTIRSGFFPKFLGWLLMVAGVGYVVTSVTFIMFPAHLHAVTKYMMPLYFGELPIILWLLIMGAKAPAEARLPA